MQSCYYQKLKGFFCDVKFSLCDWQINLKRARMLAKAHVLHSEALGIFPIIPFNRWRGECSFFVLGIDQQYLVHICCYFSFICKIDYLTKFNLGLSSQDASTAIGKKTSCHGRDSWDLESSSVFHSVMWFLLGGHLPWYSTCYDSQT